MKIDYNNVVTLICLACGLWGNTLVLMFFLHHLFLQILSIQYQLAHRTVILNNRVYQRRHLKEVILLKCVKLIKLSGINSEAYIDYRFTKICFFLFIGNNLNTNMLY